MSSLISTVIVNGHVVGPRDGAVYGILCEASHHASHAPCAVESPIECFKGVGVGNVFKLGIAYANCIYKHCVSVGAYIAECEFSFFAGKLCHIEALFLKDCLSCICQVKQRPSPCLKRQ